MKLSAKHTAVALALAIGGGLIATAVATSHQSPRDIQAPVAKEQVAAVVNGQDITQGELEPLVRGGVDRAVALDRYINKLVAAQAGEKEFSQEAKTMVEASRREVLAQVYLQKRGEQIAKAVTDGDLKSYYEKNVRDEDYRSYKVKFALSLDQAEAAKIKDRLDKSDDAAISKMAYIKQADAHYANIAEIPYGLGQVVKKAKAGASVGPIVVREGVLILYVEDIKSNQKPAFDVVKDEIRGVIVGQRLNEDLDAKRKMASIQLK